MHSSGKRRLRGATIKLDLRNRDHTGSSSHRSSLMTYSGLTKTPMTRLALLCMHALRTGEFLGTRTPDGSNPCLSVSLSFRRIPGRVAGTDRRPSAREHCGGRSAPRPAILRIILATIRNDCSNAVGVPGHPRRARVIGIFTTKTGFLHENYQKPGGLRLFPLI